MQTHPSGKNHTGSLTFSPDPGHFASIKYGKPTGLHTPQDYFRWNPNTKSYCKSSSAEGSKGWTHYGDPMTFLLEGKGAVHQVQGHDSLGPSTVEIET